VEGWRGAAEQLRAADPPPAEQRPHEEVEAT
jgi:hypothetical protein